MFASLRQMSQRLLRPEIVTAVCTKLREPLGLLRTDNIINQFAVSSKQISTSISALSSCTGSLSIFRLVHPSLAATTMSPNFLGLNCSGSLVNTQISNRGMKIQGRVKRRCKGCYFIWENGVLHNRCKLHPRHTQKQKEKYWQTQRLLTHATSGFKRPW